MDRVRVMDRVGHGVMSGLGGGQLGTGPESGLGLGLGLGLGSGSGLGIGFRSGLELGFGPDVGLVTVRVTVSIKDGGRGRVSLARDVHHSWLELLLVLQI